MEQISKNEVIELIKKYKEMAVPRWDERYTDGYSGLSLLSKLLKEIEQMETSESRPKGKWIDNPPDSWICSNCGTHYEERLTFKAHNYCCVCGARME